MPMAQIGQHLGGIPPLLDVLVQRRKATLDFCFLCVRYRDSVRVEALPKLANKLKALLRRQVAKVDVWHG
jgi:hypothetical protein